MSLKKKLPAYNLQEILVVLVIIGLTKMVLLTTPMKLLAQRVIVLRQEQLQ